jgi:hypothetical protein
MAADPGTTSPPVSVAVSVLPVSVLAPSSPEHPPAVMITAISEAVSTESSVREFLICCFPPDPDAASLSHAGGSQR